MKMVFFGPKAPEDLDGLDLSALKSFEQRGNGWSVALFDRGGDGCTPQDTRGDELIAAINRAAARLPPQENEPDERDLTISGLSTEGADRPAAGICPPWTDEQDAEKTIAKENWL